MLHYYWLDGLQFGLQPLCLLKSCLFLPEHPLLLPSGSPFPQHHRVLGITSFPCCPLGLAGPHPPGSTFSPCCLHAAQSEWLIWCVIFCPIACFTCMLKSPLSISFWAQGLFLIALSLSAWPLVPPSVLGLPHSLSRHWLMVRHLCFSDAYPNHKSAWQLLINLDVASMSVCQDSSPVTRSEILFVTQTTWSTTISVLCTREGKASYTKARARYCCLPDNPSVLSMKWAYDLLYESAVRPLEGLLWTPSNLGHSVLHQKWVIPKLAFPPNTGGPPCSCVSLCTSIARREWPFATAIRRRMWSLTTQAWVSSIFHFP